MNFRTANPTAPLPWYPGWRPQFTIRSLLILMTVAAVWLSIVKTVPHVGILLFAVATAATSTWLYRRQRSRTRGYRLGFDDQLALAVLAAIMVIAWIALYAASVGPVAAIFWHFGHPHALRPVLESLYSPMLWLHDHTPLKHALDSYVLLWRAGR